jgi:hypothetical protein
MKFDWHKRQSATRSMPLEGVKLTTAEQRQADTLSKALAGVADETLLILRAALATESLRLDAAQEWTDPGSDTDTQRQADLERTLIAWQGVYLAYIRSDARAEAKA